MELNKVDDKTAYENLLIKYAELEADNRLLEQRGSDILKELLDKNKRCIELERQIEKMKCCENCRYRHCDTSTFSVDKDGNKTFHSWNEEKERYCDTGKNGKYQCWEIEK